MGETLQTPGVGVAGCRLMDLRSYMDHRGGLVFIEGGDGDTGDLPFAIARVYYMWGAEGDTVRGQHAHKKLEQIYIAVSGACDVVLEDREGSRTVRLERPDQGVYIGHGVWRRMENFAPGTVLLVLASERYDEADYYRDREEFLGA